MGTYDYIVVGAGSSGAVVAGRLSEDAGSRVLLLEAGGSNRNMKVQVPAAFSQQFKTELDWEFYTEAEPHLDGRSIYHPRAKMLGGCSSMNAMIYMRGNRADYDAWAKGGATGWSYDEVLPFFKRSERNARGADDFHGDSGPLPIEDLRSPNPLTARIIEAMVERGLPRNADFNGPDQLGAGFNQVTQHRGRRVSTHEAFVKPGRKRTNFTVLTGAHVHRLLLEGSRVVGVEIERDGSREVHRAEREVVLSAGAFNTPQILMLSGIGPADHLREHGIDVLVDNANVGAHLMDHPIYLVNYETTATGTLAEAESPAQLARFLAAGKGLLTSNVAEASGFVHTRTDEDAPDIQILAGPAYFSNHGLTSHPRPAYVLAPSLVGSKSRGQVRLRSADPRTHAAVRFNYFAEQADMDSMVAGIEICREIAATSALSGVTGRELTPGAHAATRSELEAAIRREVEHTYHPACTARIGTEADGVVDPELRVHGVTGLRVADTSVFPTITHGNTHAPAVLVGEKAADLIRNGS